MDAAPAAAVTAPPVHLVIRLRDLTGEHDTRVWDVPHGTRWSSYRWMFTAALLEAAATVLDWRQPADDVDEPDRSIQLDHAVDFARQITAQLADDKPRPSLYGADCTLIAAVEPGEEQPR